MKKIFLAFIIICSGVVAMAQGKTAYISTDEVFSNIPQSKVADSLILKESNRLNNLYKERQEELNDLIALFVKDSITMTTEQKEVKRKSLQDKVSNLQASEQDLKAELDNYREKVYAPIKEKVFGVIRDIAKLKGCMTVLYRENAVIIPAGSDITRDVIKKMGGK